MSALSAALALVLPLALAGPQLNQPAPEAACRLRATDRDRDCQGWAVPDFAYAQSGGYLGLVVAGGGYALLDDRVNVAVGYGMSPAFQSGRTVHSLHGTLSYRPVDLALPSSLRLVPYLGVGMLVTFGEHYFWRSPGRYDPFDEEYYRSTARYWSAQLGIELDWAQPRSSAVERHGVFLEIRAIDELLFDGLANPELIEPWELGSTAFGYRIAF